MIPFIRSHAELMAMTESRAQLNERSNIHAYETSMLDSGQRKRYIRSIAQNKVDLPSFTNIKRRKWIKSSEVVSRFFSSLDYNNQIQPSYDLTLLSRQNINDNQDVA